MSSHDLSKHFTPLTLFPIAFFLLGLFIIHSFLKEEYTFGFILMLSSFVFYVIYNVILNIVGYTTVFNEYLEDLSTFLLFGVTTMIFSLLFYKGNILILFSVFFFCLAVAVSMARNWILKIKFSVGWPLPLSGLVFPPLYFIYTLYLKSPGYSIFILYYLVVGFLSISRINFLGYKELVDGKPFEWEKESKKVKTSFGRGNKIKEKIKKEKEAFENRRNIDLAHKTKTINKLDSMIDEVKKKTEEFEKQNHAKQPREKKVNKIYKQSNDAHFKIDPSEDFILDKEIDVSSIPDNKIPEDLKLDNLLKSNIALNKAAEKYEEEKIEAKESNNNEIEVEEIAKKDEKEYLDEKKEEKKSEFESLSDFIKK
jgi:hypothetical protein